VFKNRIREKRGEMGLSQTQLACRIDGCAIPLTTFR